MNAKLIDLSNFSYSGEGANGESYNHISDPSIMLKLYRNTVTEEFVRNELERAMSVASLGIPTPDPGELITDGKGRYGISFKRIRNKTSVSRAVSDHPENVGALAEEFARMCKILHSTKVKPGMFPSAKDDYLGLLDSSPYYTAGEKEKIGAFIRNVPDTDTALHGDLQFSNVIMADGKSYFIDLGDFTVGCPKFDLGMTIICGVFDDEEFTRKVFHMTTDLAYRFWENFVKYYFGEGTDIKSIEKELRPYAGLKCLMMEKYSQCELPQFHELLDDILK